MDRDTYLAAVRRYYSSQRDNYLEYFGTTWQGGLACGPDGQLSARESNLWLAARAGVQAHSRILDAGCGVCGPAMDIAETFEGVCIDAVNCEPSQIAVATTLIAGRGLAERIKVYHADFHDLPFTSATFDLVIFFESCNYSYDLPRLFAEVRRVLKPGGMLYIKDVCLAEGPLSDEQARELREFKRIYAHQTRRVSELERDIRAGGFEQLTVGSLNGLIASDHFLRAMYGASEQRDMSTLTPFGRAHFGHFPNLRTVYGEIKAIASATNDANGC